MNNQEYDWSDSIPLNGNINKKVENTNGNNEPYDWKDAIPFEQESTLKSYSRTALQALKGPAYFAASKLLGGAAVGIPEVMKAEASLPVPEEISDEARAYINRVNPNFDWASLENQLAEGKKQAAQFSEYAPSVSSVIGAGENIGIPTEARTTQDKFAETISMAWLGGKKSATVASGLFPAFKQMGYSNDQAQLLSLLGAGVGEQVIDERGLLSSGTNNTNRNLPPPGAMPRTAYSDFVKENINSAATTPEELIFNRSIQTNEPATREPQRSLQVEKRQGYEELPTILQNRFSPVQEKPVIGAREREIQAPYNMRGKPQGVQLPVSKQTGGDEISKIAAKQLGISPDQVTENQRVTMQNTLRKEGFKIAPTPNLSNPVDIMTHSVTPIKSGNKEVLGNNLKNVFNQRERSVFKEVNQRYDDAIKLTNNVVANVTEMVPELQEIYDNHINSSDPVMADVAKEANKLINEISIDGQPRPVSFSFLVNRIKEIQSGSKHKFANDPKNAYSMLTGVIERQLDKANGLSAEAVNAWKNARDFYRNDYARVFKNPESFNLLNNKYIQYEDLYNNITKPSLYNFFEPELRHSAEGIRILDAAKRDILEKKLNTAFKDETNIKQSELTDVLDDIGINITQEERTRIYDALKKLKTEQAKLKEREFKLSRKNIQEIKKPEPVKETPPKKRNWTDERKKNWWINASEKQIENATSDITGLRIMKKMYPKLKSEDIAAQAALRRIYKSQNKSEKLYQTVEKMLKDLDDREFLDYALGKEEVSKLEKFVKQSSELDKESWAERLKLLGKRQALHIGMKGLPVPGAIKMEIIESLVPKKKNK